MTSGVGLTTAAARAVLVPVGESAGLADAVAQRLSAAIRTGLLLDGERLPAEPRLAEQLGISTVTLREALAVLREQGLVVTRRGRGGGTFVAAPDLASELGGRLREFSTGHLRDLGDQRAAVSGMAARLAAERAQPGEVDGLRVQVARLRAASTVSDRRRAATQFSLTVAAAAQSPRLVAAELQLAAEIGGVLWLRATDDEHEASVSARDRIVDAIAAREPAAARDLAERQVEAETSRLIDLRLRAYDLDRAPDPLAGAPGRTGQAADTLQGVGVELDRLVADIGTLGEEFARICAGPVSHDDLAQLRPMIFGTLDRHPGIVAGAGVIAAPGVLADAPLWLEWWFISSAGTPEWLRANLDPAAPDFYDYTTAEWYAAAERSEAGQTVGPYVDHFCTGDYTVTLSVPVRTGGRLVGVAAADVLVSSLERQVLPALLAAGATLTNGDGRVIASASPHTPPGLRIAPADATKEILNGRWRLSASG